MPAPKKNQYAAKPPEDRQEARITWALRQREKNMLVKQAQREGRTLVALLRNRCGLPPD